MFLERDHVLVRDDIKNYEYYYGVDPFYSFEPRRT